MTLVARLCLPTRCAAGSACSIEAEPRRTSAFPGGAWERGRGGTMAREIPTAFAIGEALRIAMETDPDVILMGEDVAGGGTRPEGTDEAGGILGTTRGLVKLFPDRVLDTPISEMALVGSAVGAAATGLR